MPLYEYTPKKSNKKVLGIIIILVSLALGLFAFTLIFSNMPFKWIFQLISIASFVAVIFIITRYVAKSFCYAIIKTDNDTLDFTVDEIANAGRSKATVCRIAITSIEEAYLLDKSIDNNSQKITEIEKKAKADGRKFFNYSPDINPTVICILLVEECGEKFLIKLSPDHTLWTYLKK